MDNIKNTKNVENIEKEKNCDFIKRRDRKVEPVYSRNKIGRNELCPCGSKKKYKQCCLNNKN